MKKALIACITGLVLMAICLLFLMIAVINKGGLEVRRVNTSNLELVNTQEVDMGDISSVDIRFSSDDVVFYTSDSDKLILKEYMNYTPEDHELAKITTTGQGVSIQGRRNDRKVFISWNENSRAEIYLPVGYAGSINVNTSSGDILSDLVLALTEFVSNSSSGDVYINEIKGENIKITTSSGNITIEKAEGNRQLSATSGDIRVFGGEGDSEVRTSSGNITMENAVGKVYISANSGDIKLFHSIGEKNIKSSSGNITLDNVTGLVEITSSSGDVRIMALSSAGTISTSSGNILYELDEVTDDITIKANSGDVTLSLPREITCDFAARTTSGSINTFFDDALSYDEDREKAEGMVGEGEDRMIRIDTTSGNIKVLD